MSKTLVAQSGVQGQSLICDPRPSLANQSWVDARIRKSGNQNNKNRKTQLRSKLVWFIDQWKGVDWATGLERAISRAQCLLAPRRCGGAASELAGHRDVGHVLLDVLHALLDLLSQLLDLRLELVAARTQDCSAILELLENGVLLGIIRHYWLYWLYWLFIGCCSTFGSSPRPNDTTTRQHLRGLHRRGGCR